MPGFEKRWERLMVHGKRFATRLPVAAALVVLPMLSGCATPGGGEGFTQASRVGPDDGTDSCHAQAVALDETGDFFGQDILAGAAMGAAGGALIGGLVSGNLKGALIGAVAGGAAGAAGGYWEALQQQNENTAQLESTVAGNLTTENAQIDKTQLAFNEDMDCRFQQAATIRANYKAGTITEDQAVTQMAQVKTWAQRDLQLAQTINGQIQSRGQQFDTAATNLGAAPTAAPAPSLSKPAILRYAEPLLLQPDPDAPVVGQVARHQDVTITSVEADYALVQTDDGASGFVRLADLREPKTYRTIYVPPYEQLPAPQAAPEAESSSATAAYVPPSSTPSATTSTSSAATSSPPASTATVQQLDGSNAASRDAFAQNVATTQSAVSNGFQLST
jgi:hypothetical protein